MKATTKTPHGDTIKAESKEDAERIVAAIEALNERARVDAGSDTFLVSLRSRREWIDVGGGPTDAFQCAVLAASLAAADRGVAAVFSLGQDGTLDGPHLTFGPPELVLEAWVEDSGFPQLAPGAAQSVTFNSARIRLMGLAAATTSSTEH